MTITLHQPLKPQSTGQLFSAEEAAAYLGYATVSAFKYHVYTDPKADFKPYARVGAKPVWRKADLDRLKALGWPRRDKGGRPATIKRGQR